MLELLPFISCNLITAVILLLLYFNKSPSGVKVVDQQHFDRMILATIVVLFADTGMWLINNQAFAGARIINIVVSMLCYALTPCVGLLCVVYTDYKIHGDTPDKSFKRLLPFFIVFALCLLLLVIDLVIPANILFTVTEQNEYIRGDAFWLFTVIPFVFMMFSFITTRIASKKVTNPMLKRELNYMSWFVIPPLIGGTLQTITGLSFTWGCVSISLLILFIKFQNQQVATDNLTGLNNRRQLENYLIWQLQLPQDSYIFALMLDIDGFKAINDTLGHALGDDALIDAARILKDSVGKNDFVARYGGDEFVVIAHRTDEDGCKNLIDNINILVNSFNVDADRPYKLTFSIGYSVYQPHSDDNYETFLSRADKSMYCMKNEHLCNYRQPK